MDRMSWKVSKQAMLCISMGLSMACGRVEDESVRGRRYDVATQAMFDVEVRYAGGVTRQEAQQLLDTVEIVPTSEFIAGSGDATEPASEQLELLDGSEPTVDIVLHPLNEAAAARRYGWRATVALEAAAPHSPAGPTDVATQKQALSGDVFASSVYLGHGDVKRSSRYYCRAFTLQATSVTGAATSCIDLGYEGKADTLCTFSSVPIVTHPGPNLNPLDKHYFRGRFNAVFGPAWIIGGSVLCL